MTKVVVNLNEMSKLNGFVNEVATFESDVDAVRDHYIVDAKSIMGMFSFDLSKDLEIILHSDDDAEIARFIEVMKKYQ